MMPHHYRPSSRYEESSIDDSPSSGDDNVDYEGSFQENCSSRDARATFISEHPVARVGDRHNFVKRSNIVDDIDDLCSRSSKRYLSDAANDHLSGPTLVDSNILRPSLAMNISGSDATHAMKNGQKLIGELHDKKNEIYMNAILREASREGFMKSLAFPNRSKWLVVKVPIWFGSGGILGRYFYSSILLLLFSFNIFY
jgi:hypothetical protein